MYLWSLHEGELVAAMHALRSTSGRATRRRHRMDPVENQRSTALELVARARALRIDLERFRDDMIFQNLAAGRCIFFWRKVDAMPCTGRPDELEGTLKYNLQGSIHELPCCLHDSANEFRGMWSESGTLENIDQAITLAAAWWLQGKEVDELPVRCIKRYQI